VIMTERAIPLIEIFADDNFIVNETALSILRGIQEKVR
jgi:hypothetical protein